MVDDLTPHYRRLAHSAALVGEFDGSPDRQAELLRWALEAVREIARARGIGLPEPEPEACQECGVFLSETEGVFPLCEACWSKICDRLNTEVLPRPPCASPAIEFAAAEIERQERAEAPRPQFGWEHVLATVRREGRPYEVLIRYPDAWGNPEVLVPVVLITEASGRLSLYLPNGLPARAHGEAKALLEARGLRRLDRGVEGPTGLYYDVVPVEEEDPPIEAGAGFAPGELARPVWEREP